MRPVRAITVTALLCGCATLGVPSSGVQEIRDDFRGTTVYRMWGNTLSGGGNILTGLEPTASIDVDLNAQKAIPASAANPSYSLVVEYRAPDWLFIKDGQSLSMIIDGEPLHFRGDGSMQNREVGRVGYRGGVTERAFYQVTPEQLRRIASATTIRVRVDGDSRYVERTMSPEIIANFHKFVTMHVK
jgi:hypothetical protein